MQEIGPELYPGGSRHYGYCKGGQVVKGGCDLNHFVSVVLEDVCVRRLIGESRKCGTLLYQTLLMKNVGKSLYFF